MNKPENPPAFPHTRVYSHACNDLLNQELPMSGLSMRDYMAAKALAGLMANGDLNFINVLILDGESLGTLAKASYALADAMLKEREAK